VCEGMLRVVLNRRPVLKPWRAVDVSYAMRVHLEQQAKAAACVRWHAAGRTRSPLGTRALHRPSMSCLWRRMSVPGLQCALACYGSSCSASLSNYPPSVIRCPHILLPSAIRSARTSRRLAW
jgi:hypothetical protein